MHREGVHPYRAYVLRCWREEGRAIDGAPSWRFSVEEILDERRRTGFDSLEALISFLRDELSIGDPDQSGSSTASP